MTDDFNPTRPDQAGMDPEGLMPADPALHELDEGSRQDIAGGSTTGGSTTGGSTTSDSTSGDSTTGNGPGETTDRTADAVADAIVSPHDQPVEGGVEEAEEGRA